jgi:RND superfamily putative drug exporter
MLQILRACTSFASNKTGAKIVLGFWVVLVLALVLCLPGSKKFALNSNPSDLPAYVPSEVARGVVEQHFPSSEGLTALLVFHAETALSDNQTKEIADASRWLAEQKEQKEQGVAEFPPLHQMPPAAWGSLYSADQTTVMLPVRLQGGLDSKQVHEVVQGLNDHFQKNTGQSLLVSITGPAGISSDAIGVFRNADFVLMLTSIVIILVLLILLYRSPLLAILPLAIAGVLYEVVDRLLGFAAEQGWFIVESQALSIMIILLFAVLTDYCLFVFSRYREELQTTSSQYEAMRVAMGHVGEPIFFSGSIILVSVLTLSVALFKPYQHFAPVFGVALFVILAGGLTLVPASFALLGRKAFWPFLPKLGVQAAEPKGMWKAMGQWVTKKPRLIAGLLSLVLLGATLLTWNIPYSFNLLKSFPSASSSRVGFEVLQEHFPPGALAPVTVVVAGSEKMDAEDAPRRFAEALRGVSGVQSVSSPELAGDKQAWRYQLVLADDPYEKAAFQTVESLRKQGGQLLQLSGFATDVSLHLTGQTPLQLDTRDVNQRDTAWVMLLVIVLLTILLIFQSRSLIAPLYMVATILLTYGTALGASWAIFHYLLGYEAISYRIPLYSFVFLVALGIDYNILLLSRVREEAQSHPLPLAIQRAVAMTGKTISSAGLILVATFAVLMTQPLLELFMFGFVVAFGVLIDTFVVRGLLMPSVMMLLGRWNWWPKHTEKRGSLHV